MVSINGDRVRLTGFDIDSFVGAIPVGRAGVPDDVAGVVSLLA
jgi:hypothetical protein